MPAPEPITTERDADRQFVIFLSSILVAVGITVASLIIAACNPT